MISWLNSLRRAAFGCPCHLQLLQKVPVATAESQVAGGCDERTHVQPSTPAAAGQTQRTRA